MFKSGDKVTFEGREPSRQVEVETQEDYKIVPGREIEIEAKIGQLNALYIPVRLKDGTVRQILYKDLKINNKGVVALKEKLPDVKKITKEGVEFYVPGKTITVRGKVSLANLLIPVETKEEGLRMIPFKELKFYGGKK